MAHDALPVMKGTLELLVLKSLSRCDEMHGFEILDWIARGSAQTIGVEEGALYPALHRMEKRGLLSSAWGVSDKGRRAKYYRLTTAGRAALQEQEGTWDRYVAAVARLGSQGTAPEG